MDDIDEGQKVLALLTSLKRALPTLQALRDDVTTRWGEEDGVYRFYHQSFKVFGLQQTTVAIVAALQALAPERELNRWFAQIVAEGTGKRFASEDNKRWLEVTRPIVEAFFHARYFLEMALKYSKELEAPPSPMPSGWAALLYLYDLR